MLVELASAVGPSIAFLGWRKKDLLCYIVVCNIPASGNGWNMEYKKHKNICK